MFIKYNHIIVTAWLYIMVTGIGIVQPRGGMWCADGTVVVQWVCILYYRLIGDYWYNNVVAMNKV